VAKAREGKRAAQAKGKKSVMKAAGTSNTTKAKKAAAATKRHNAKKSRTPSATRRKREVAYIKAAGKAIKSTGKASEVGKLAQTLAFLKSDRVVYCAVPQIKRLVALGKEMMTTKEITAAQFYQTYVCYTQYLRYRKIDGFEYLQRLAKRKQLLTKFLDAWNMEQSKNQAGEEYAKAVGRKLLKKEDEVEEGVFESLAETTARIAWGKGANKQDIKLPKTYPIHLLSDKTCPYSKDWVKTHLPPLVMSTLDDFTEANVREWIRKADGKRARLYIMVHNEEMVGFLYQELVKIEGQEVPLIRAYGLAADLRDKGLGSALIYVVFKALAKSPYIVADIDKAHKDSLACITRAAKTFERKVVALGRIIVDGGSLKVNRHPHYEIGETMEYCAMLKGAPELTDREEEKDWPKLDVPATKGGKGEQGEGKKKDKQEGKMKRGRGRPHKSIQFLKKGARKQEEEKKKEEMKKGKKNRSKKVKKKRGRGEEG